MATCSKVFYNIICKTLTTSVVWEVSIDWHSFGKIVGHKDMKLQRLLKAANANWLTAEFREMV